MPAFLPDRATVREVAASAALGNTHPSARAGLEAKLEEPPGDWDERTVLTVPGLVWSVSGDTCMTGRLSAPDNIAYDHYGREFVFRQPRNETELAAVMSADSDEVMACYRFDGLSRWTSRSVMAWMEDMEVVLGYVRQVLSTEVDADILDGLRQYEEYLTGTDIRDDLGALRELLDDQEPAPITMRRVDQSRPPARRLRLRRS
ncbi:hypothetical protein ACOACQ_00745 [Nocardioides sp. CPCC 206347]|uniref:hypothetical protein n=1 Tax=Nocardioides sp. CPCC 206347 TaxID=3406463 RepID=UPI003B435FA3